MSTNPSPFSGGGGGVTFAEVLSNPAGAEAPYPRIYMQSTAQLTTGDLQFGVWRAASTASCGHVLTCTAGTAMATATYAAIGVYSVDASGNLTQVATTGDLHTTIWAATFTGYNVPFTSSFTRVAGQLYALGVLVTATTTPILYGQTGQAVFSQFGGTNFLPWSAGALTGQVALPASVPAGSVAAFPGFFAGAILSP
jgi:hypothetical protein